MVGSSCERTPQQDFGVLAARRRETEGIFTRKFPTPKSCCGVLKLRFLMLCDTIAAMVLLQHMLPYVQIGLSVALIVTILLQRTGASMGGAFGADNFSSGFHTRRGLERTLFHVTIALGILFALSALINLIIS